MIPLVGGPLLPSWVSGASHYLSEPNQGPTTVTSLDFQTTFPIYSKSSSGWRRSLRAGRASSASSSATAATRGSTAGSSCPRCPVPSLTNLVGFSLILLVFIERAHFLHIWLLIGSFCHASLSQQGNPSSKHGGGILLVLVLCED